MGSSRTVQLQFTPLRTTNMVHMFTLVALHMMLFPSGAPAANVTGYVVDNYCWNKPNHVGIDGANLEFSPANHWLHCLTLSFCIPDGYVLLEEYSQGGQVRYQP